MLHMAMAAAFESWVKEVESQRRQEENFESGVNAMRRVVLRMQKASVAAGLRAWQEHTHVHIHDEQWAIIQNYAIKALNTMSLKRAEKMQLAAWRKWKQVRGGRQRARGSGVGWWRWWRTGMAGRRAASRRWVCRGWRCGARVASSDASVARVRDELRFCGSLRSCSWRAGWVSRCTKGCVSWP